MRENNYQCSEERVKENLKQFSFFSFKKGWIPLCFKGLDDKKFSFVHIDVDFYEPIRDSYNFFKNKIKKEV